ncbi:MAG: succinate dehydrogenase [Paracoccaceae bacterium]|nr:succinate dehydrogenase [Paracoccaceae bacterium]
MRGLAIIVAFALVGCDVANDALDREVRQTADTVINGVITDRFPCMDPAPVTNCFIDNASRGEIVDIARAAVTGVDDSTVTMVLNIGKRPETLKCLVLNDTGALL